MSTLTPGILVDAYDQFFEAGPGAYWKLTIAGEPQALWMNIPPCGHVGRLATQLRDGQRHTVTEHEDGAITVSPSIFCQGADGKTPCWHGYLEHGIWREL